jgi:hypothetical protein
LTRDLHSFDSGNTSFTLVPYRAGMRSYVLRVWIPDRPGALGQVASRIGAVRGDVVGIDILERGGGTAVDELVVQLPDETLVELLVTEVCQVDGVRVEEVRPLTEALHDPRLDALETAAILVGASGRAELVEAVVDHGLRVMGGEWAAVVGLESQEVLAGTGPTPSAGWLAAFVEGSRSSGGLTGPDDVVWAPLPSAGLALVLGRSGVPFRARERRQVAALARIVDTRLSELARRDHPARSR